MSQPIGTTTNSMSLGIKLAICLVAFFLVGLGVGVVLLRNNTSTQTPETVSQVYVKVQYAGQWQGTYGDPTAVVSWNGYGDKTVTLTRPTGTAGTTWIIAANAQKMDGSTNTLTAMITKTDGAILKEASTTTPYGVVQVGYMFEGNTGSTYTPPQTFTFMKTEELKITSMTFAGTANITLTVKNPGTSKVTVSTVTVNDGAKTVSTTYPALPLDVTAGATTTLYVTMSSAWTTGNKYKVTLLSSSGTTVAAYETTA